MQVNGVNNWFDKSITTGRSSDLNDNSLNYHLVSSQNKITKLSVLLKFTGFVFIVLGLFGIIIQWIKIIAAHDSILISESDSKIKIFKFPFYLVMIRHMLGVFGSSLIVWLGRRLYQVSKRPSSIRLQQLYRSSKWIIIFYFVILWISWILNWVITFIAYNNWAADGYKEPGDYTLIDQYHGFSFSKKIYRVSGGAQQSDNLITAFGLIYATCLAIIGWLTWCGFSTLILYSIKQFQTISNEIELIQSVVDVELIKQAPSVKSN